MTQQTEEYTKEKTIEELKSLIKTGIRKEGLENTVTEIGVSLFQSEAVMHELLCLVVATQKALIDKQVLTPEELDVAINATIDAHVQSVDSVLDTLDEENESTKEV